MLAQTTVSTFPPPLQVVADYRKARALLADQAIPASSAAAGGTSLQQAQQQPDSGMWGRLMDEIDKVGMHFG